MKILYVAADIDVGGEHGGSTHVNEVVEHLGKENDVRLVGKDAESPDIGVTFWDFPGIRRLFPLVNLLQAWRAAKAFGPDVVYERASSYGLGALLSRLLGVPLVVEVNDLKSSSLSFRQASRIITTSEILVPERFHGKTEEVAWGANVDLFDPEENSGSGVRERYGLEGKNVVGYVGGFYRWHGLEDIVEAAEEVGDAVFVLVGGGRLRNRIEDMVEERRMEDRFVFTGRVPHEEVPEHVAAFDVCLAPYNPERHRKLKKTGIFYTPLKIFEYMAAGKPVVTTDSGKLAEMFDDGEDALLVEPGNPGQLASAVNRLLEDQELAGRIAGNGRDLVINNYSWEGHCKRLQEIFEEVTA